MSSKELERSYLQRFADARPDLDLADAEDSESPDFLVRRGARVLGIEVTRYSPPLREDGFIPEEQKSLRERVMSRSRALYEAAGGAPLHVQTLFNDHRPLRSRRVDALAQELARFLLQASVGVPVYSEVPFRASDKYPYMTEIGHIGAHRVPAPDYGVWYAGEAGWVRDAVAEDLLRVLADKERRVPEYRAQCSEVWLLVVFDMLPGGEYVQGPFAKAPPVVASQFDRVFALERVTRRCVEVPVHSAA